MGDVTPTPQPRPSESLESPEAPDRPGRREDATMVPSASSDPPPSDGSSRTVTDPVDPPASDIPAPSIIAPAVTGRDVWRPTFDARVTELLSDVRGTLERAVPRGLAPTHEPLARLVPLLLAVLGAFLALQRGIGKGLGHVPMVASAAPRDPARRA